MTDVQIRPAPVSKTVTVKAGQRKAFEVFTSGMGRWWPRSHSIHQASPQRDVIVEPRAGGRWYEVCEDGTQCEWGSVRLWEPYSRVVLIWSLDADWAYDAALETEVEIRFTPQDDGMTRVDLEHRDLERFGERAPMVRAAIDSPQGWGGILAGYAQAVQA